MRLFKLFAPLVLAVVTAAPVAALAADSLAGKTVYVKMARVTTPDSGTDGFDGTVKSTDANGIFLNATTTDTWSNKGGYKNNQPYKFVVFVPWSSVAYVKVK